MKIISIVGSGSGSGKTTVACRILEAFPGLAAVKISPRQGVPRLERGPGAAGKDTARFLESGAAAVYRVIGPRESVPQTWSRMAPALEGFPGAVVEGAQGIELPGERMVIFVLRGDATLRPDRNAKLLSRSDLVVLTGSREDRSGAAATLSAVPEAEGRRVVRVDLSAGRERGIENVLREVRAFLG